MEQGLWSIYINYLGRYFLEKITVTVRDQQQCSSEFLLKRLRSPNLRFFPRVKGVW